MSQTNRIEMLDFLRGAAILGMLVANVPWHTGNSMSRISDPDVASVSAWLFQYLIIDQRFMPIFCMLFGAGLLLLAKGRDPDARFHLYFLRRMGILFAIGLAHAYLIWPGDILLNYAICGVILLLFYRLSAVWLLAAGIGFKAIHFAFLIWPGLPDILFQSWVFGWWLDIGEAPMSGVEAYAGSYGDLFEYNAWRNQFIQWTAMLDYRIWNAAGFMLIGMALYRGGVLTGEASTRVYRRIFFASLAAGLPFLAYGMAGRIGASETLAAYLDWQVQLPHHYAVHLLGTVFTSFTMLSGLILLFRTAPHSAVFAPIRAVGRMALTNYVMHSVIFFVIFAVFEWAPFDVMDPDDRLSWVVGIWALQLVISPLWLSRFRSGPLETGWRYLAGPGLARKT